MKISKFAVLFLSIFQAFVFWSQPLCMDGKKEARKAWGEHQPKMALISKEHAAQYPYNAVLSLKVTHENGQFGYATGFLSGDGFALTSAHVVFDPEHGLASKIECLSRYDNDNSKTLIVHKYAFPRLYQDTAKSIFEFCSARKAFRSSGSVSQASWRAYRTDPEMESMASCDFALLYLKLMDYQGYQKDYYQKTGAEPKFIEPVSYYTHPRNDLRFCGYPGSDYNYTETSRDHSTAPYMYEKDAQFEKQTTEFMKFATPSYGGMSGSPIMYYARSSLWWRATGILSICSLPGVEPSFTLGCRLTKDKIKLIDEWKRDLKYFIKPGSPNAVYETLKDEIPSSSSSSSAGIINSISEWFDLN